MSSTILNPPDFLIEQHFTICKGSEFFEENFMNPSNEVSLVTVCANRKEFHLGELARVLEKKIMSSWNFGLISHNTYIITKELKYRHVSEEIHGIKIWLCSLNQALRWFYCITFCPRWCLPPSCTSWETIVEGRGPWIWGARTINFQITYTYDDNPFLFFYLYFSYS